MKNVYTKVLASIGVSILLFSNIVSANLCVVDQEDPTGCDLSDVGVAGICYVPSNFGTVMMVSNGKVGINTSTPAYALDVNGSVRGAGVLLLSDARLKTSIEKIDGALEKISKINGYTFTWKDSGEADMGVLAQEIEAVFANAVETDPSGTKTVQYNELIAPIIEAIHEINTLIDDQAQKAAAQADRITELEKTVK